MMEFIVFLTRIFLSKIRYIKYKLLFSKLGKHVDFLGKINTINPSNITIGNFTVLNEGVILNGTDKIKIGNYVHISSNAQIQTGGLDLNMDYRFRKHIRNPIFINDGVWICSGAIIISGVSIGEGSVIAAGAVVIRNVPEFELWGGVPAKKIKDLKRLNN